MKHQLREAGHECDRFVARGLTCPFKRMEEEEPEEDPEEKQDPAMEFPQIIPIGERRRGADSVRGANVTDFINAVAPGETRTALERMAAIQNVGGLSFIPTREQLASAFSGQTSQGIMAVLTAIAVAVASSRMRGIPSGRMSLGVAASERQVAEQLSTPGLGREPSSSLLGGRNRRSIRKFFGFGPVAGFDAFSETGFT